MPPVMPPITSTTATAAISAGPTAAEANRGTGPARGFHTPAEQHCPRPRYACCPNPTSVRYPSPPDRRGHLETGSRSRCRTEFPLFAAACNLLQTSMVFPPLTVPPRRQTDAKREGDEITSPVALGSGFKVSILSPFAGKRTC